MHGEDLSGPQQRAVDEIQKKIRYECVKIFGRDVTQNPNKYKTTRAAILQIATEENEKQDEEEQMSAEMLPKFEDQKVVSHYVKKEYVPRYQFPQKEILGHIKGVVTTMSQIEHMEDTPGQQEQKALPLNGLDVFQEKLKDWNIPLQSILSPYAQQTFNSIMNHSDQTRKKWQSVVDELNKPTKDQEEIWQLVALGIRDIVTTVYTQEMLDETSVKKGR